MADQEEEDLKMALHMSMQHTPPEPKRSKPRDAAVGAPVTSPEDCRRMQRELMAAAAEKRMKEAKSAPAASNASVSSPKIVKSCESALKEKVLETKEKAFESKEKVLESKEGNLGKEEANQLFSMLFGSGVSKDILAQWSNQGIRFSSDPETSMGLVQHEGGPCGVLATIQAFVLKYLLFFTDELGNIAPDSLQNLGARSFSKNQYVATSDFASLSEHAKVRALVKSMSEILFLCGNNRRAVIATLTIIGHEIEGSEDCKKYEAITKALEGLSIESGSDLQKVLRVDAYTSQASVLQRLEAIIPVFESRMGAMLFLISALLSRGLDAVQADRDDPSLPLVTAPFGHASQEIVNLLLCGQAVPNVFDGRMDLGGGMFLKGISTRVEVGFLTLLESLNFCKVGQNLKCPKWPIWVVGSESHYTVLFALDTSVQDENEFEEREAQIRKVFDAQDQSGGGGFISVEGFHHVLREANIRLPREKVDNLCSAGFIVWSEFWQVILDLDKNLGGLKDSTGLMGKKVFDLYHFNGIAKSDLNGSQLSFGGEIPVQRPRLTKLRVSVPPRWTPEEFLADVVPSGFGANESSGKETEVAKPEPPQHAPLVDCIRTRWARAICNWVGDPPSIV
ncbi:ubiquitin carboxyl-terminal hydrolase MINDY-3-like [Mangifera indica]|uniref:ubiquitin carboxyl-terminal hydrolase MINDY-3-like n=1 Tax=Mangifera indica TaxID=29780 RepID=UPI001CF98A23|nr:ubiquitin carboxyl-terminal hydrolase MINDY-3-like [Mangifera indica]